MSTVDQTNDSMEVNALARGLHLLHFIAESQTAVTLKDITTETGIPKATTLRLLSTLVSGGLLRRRNDTGQYELAPGVVALGQAFLNKIDMRTAALPHMQSFAEETGVTVHLGTPDRLDMVLLETVRPVSAAIVMRIGIGARLGLTSSACGRAYLVSLPEVEREHLVNSLRMHMQERWPAAAASLAKAQDDYAALGYVSSYGEWHPEVNAIATPIRMPNGETYVLNCGGPAYKYSTQTLVEKVAPRLLMCLKAITDEVGADVSPCLQPVKSK